MTSKVLQVMARQKRHVATATAVLTSKSEDRRAGRAKDEPADPMVSFQLIKQGWQ